MVPGLWFDHNGPIAKKIQEQGFSIFGELLGLDTQEARTQTLIEYLRAHPEISTLVGHSAGCITTIEALRLVWLQDQIKEVVLMNSAPLDGTMFLPWDPTSCVTMKYLVKLLKGQPIKLSECDAKNLLGEHINMDDITADSGAFIRSVLSNQLPWKKPQIQHLQKILQVTSVFSRNDRILGSTANKTKKQFSENTEGKSLIIGEGHMYALINFHTVMEQILL